MTIEYSTAMMIAKTVFVVFHVLLLAAIALGVMSIHRKLTRRVCKGCGNSVTRCMCEDWK